ncbi:Rdl2p [Sugiyamaella lignohabitans]|uniref:Rdl2p n=1 Tax=Sugiyamaella lignohabitans TaxID=796027 RepID=A0A167F3Y2_9ASCO|nr:Rdl2p [Sugiyamaella lignohabitans]ANB14799.1 Rdl2p [Sugiyamaella lignohabitans]
MFRPGPAFRQSAQGLKRLTSGSLSPSLVVFRQASVLSTGRWSSIRTSRPTVVATAAPTRSQRFYSPLCIDKPAKVYEFADVKKLSDAKEHPGVILVDVREPHEYKEGHIPSAINIPYNSSPGALGLEPEDFEETFGFSKPSPESKLVFYCLGGVRSSASEGLAATYGYQW